MESLEETEEAEKLFEGVKPKISSKYDKNYKGTESQKLSLKYKKEKYIKANHKLLKSVIRKKTKNLKRAKRKEMITYKGKADSKFLIGNNTKKIEGHLQLVKEATKPAQ